MTEEDTEHSTPEREDSLVREIALSFLEVLPVLVDPVGLEPAHGGNGQQNQSREGDIQKGRCACLRLGSAGHRLVRIHPEAL